MTDDVLQMFLEDTKEHLADIETDLLDIEEAGEDFDPELVNKVFRTAHSIKGSAGFLALDNIRDLSHKIENVLDMVRSREIVPTPEVINVILRAFDRLEDMVDDVGESENMDISEHVRALTELITGNLPEELQAEVSTTKSLSLPDGREVFDVTEHDLRQARRGGNYIYLVEYDLIHDVHRKDKTPLELLHFLETSGLILDCRLDLNAVGGLEGEPNNRIPFYILYASILEPDLVKAIFQVDEQYIHLVEDGDATPLEEPPAEAPSPAPEPAGPDQDDELADMERRFDEALARQAAAPATDAPAGGAAESAEAEEVEEVEGFTLSGTGESGVLRLHGELTLEQAQAVKTALLRGIERYQDLRLDWQDVEEADLSLLQMLCAAHRTVHQQGKTLRCAQSPPQALLDVARRAGFDANTYQRCGLDGCLLEAAG